MQSQPVRRLQAAAVMRLQVGEQLVTRMLLALEAGLGGAPNVQGACIALWSVASLNSFPGPEVTGPLVSRVHAARAALSLEASRQLLVAHAAFSHLPPPERRYALLPPDLLQDCRAAAAAAAAAAGSEREAQMSQMQVWVQQTAEALGDVLSDVRGDVQLEEYPFPVDVVARHTASGRVLVVEADGPSRFGANVRRRLGPSALRNMLLRGAGYVVVAVPYWEWNAAPDKVRYLKDLVQSQVAAAKNEN